MAQVDQKSFQFSVTMLPRLVQYNKLYATGEPPLKINLTVKCVTYAMTYALASAVLHSEGSAGEGPSPERSGTDKRFICVTHCLYCLHVCAYDTVADQPAFVTLSCKLNTM
jgi:hypothetical protein